MHEPHAVSYIWLIPVLPLVGAIINGTAGWWLQARVGRWVNGVIANVAVWSAFIVAVNLFFVLKAQPAREFLLNHLYSWISAGTMEVALSFAIDPLSAVLMLVIPASTAGHPRVLHRVHGATRASGGTSRTSTSSSPCSSSSSPTTSC